MPLRAQAAPLDDEALGLSSTKKRRKKFGLAAKLESVLKQHRSDMALREHKVAAGDEEEEELYLMVAEVVKRDAFMTELRDRIRSVGKSFSSKMALRNLDELIDMIVTHQSWWNIYCLCMNVFNKGVVLLIC